MNARVHILISSSGAGCGTDRIVHAVMKLFICFMFYVFLMFLFLERLYEQ